ncbi:MAG: TAXI family TRAP transporter solute-binding subunit [Pseudomonadota bacterium]|nr:TAXI family TRAP transporter solute-binding subunit [Pseudomonadota bacterium]
MTFLSRIRGHAAVTATVLTLSLAAGASAESITVTAGSPGGGYFQAAAAFAEYVKSDVPGAETTVIPGGGWANVDRLQPANKLADVAVLENALATMAYAGEGPDGKKYDFRMMAGVRGPSAAQAVVPVDRNITSFEQILAEKIPVRIAMFERIQLATAQALGILEGYGLTKEKIESFGGKVIFTSHGDGIRMVMDGQADMWFTGGSFFPHPQYIKVGSKTPFRLLPISKEVAEKVAAKYGQTVMEMPAGIYDQHNGSNEAYWTPATVIALGVRTDLSDDLVYSMLKALVDNKDKYQAVHPQHKFFEPDMAWKTVGAVPLHPGAIRYYKEMGYMN